VRGNTNLGIRLLPGSGSTPIILEDNYDSDNANDNLLANGIRIFVKGGTYAGATGTHAGIHLQSGTSGSLIEGCSIYDNTDNGIVLDSGVANVDIRDCWFNNIVGTNQPRAVQEQTGAGPTRITNCRIQNQSTNRYVFNNTQSIYTDELTPAPTINTMGAVLYYDGSTGWVTVPDNASLDVTAGVSIELWYNPAPTQTSNATLFGKNSQFMIEGNGTGTDLKWHFFTNVAGSDRDSGAMATALTPGRFNHLVCTYDSSTHIQKIYLNGVLDYSNTLTGLGSYTISTSTNILYIGTRQNFTTTRGATGQMGEVRLWNGAISATDVANHFASKEDVTTTTTSTLVSRWKSNEGTGTTLNDSVGANTGTIVGAGTWNYPYTGYAERLLLATGASHTVDDVITALQKIGLLRQT
jgi:hypothetical protein